MDKKYIQLLKNIKEKIHQAQRKAALSINTEMLQLYWTIGNEISTKIKEAGWGTKVTTQIAKDLKSEFPEMSGFSPRNLRYMRSFAEAYPLILQPSVAKLQTTENKSITNNYNLIYKIPWTHHTIILDRIKSADQRLFYIRKTAENGWTKNILSLQIEGKLHERHGQAITNFDSTLPLSQSNLARETLKNPYLFDFLSIGENIQERELEKALVQHMKKFLLELGKGFAYVGNQQHLQVANEDFYMDLLFYNFHLHCFVVFELKLGDFKPEYVGKLNFYVNSIDEQIKSEIDNQTIGVLLCKTPNETVIKYSLQGLKSPLGIADYQLPKNLKTDLPTIKELESALKSLKDT